MLGVGSTTATTPPARSSFSNYGDALVRLGAPGDGVITTYPGGKLRGRMGHVVQHARWLQAPRRCCCRRIRTLDQQTADVFLGKADKMKGAGMGRGRLNLFDAVRQMPDETAPTVAFVTPAGGATVQNSVTVSVSASDNSASPRVRFLLNGQSLGAEDTAAPYQVLVEYEVRGERQLRAHADGARRGRERVQRVDHGDGCERLRSADRQPHQSGVGHDGRAVP